MTAAPIHVEVALDHAVHGALGDGEAELEREIAHGLEGVRSCLGIEDDAGCAVRVSAKASSGHSTFALRIDGTDVGHPNWWERRPWLFRGIAGLPCYAPTGTLRELAATAPHAATIVAAAVIEAAAWRADLLLGAERAASLADDERAAVRAALRLGLPGGRRSAVRRARLAVGAADDGGLALTEEVISQLAPGRWEIFAHPDYLQELADIDSSEESPFPTARKEFADRLGVRLPRLSVREDASLPERGFAISTGVLRSPPIIGLAPAAVLVTADDDAGDVSAVRPFDGVPARVLERSDGEDPLAMNALEVIASALQALAAGRIGSLVTVASVDADLMHVGYVVPSVVQAAREQIPLPVLASLRRRLAHEWLGSVDLLRLLQIVLDDVAVRGALAPVPELLRIVRLASRSQITAGAAYEHQELRVLEVSGDEDSETLSARIAAAGTDGLAVVTPPEHRERVFETLVDEWRGVVVIATDELAPEAVLRPV